MAVAAFVISILALIASVLSALYTRKQAEHAGVLAKIEKRRSHKERTPSVVVKPVHEFDRDINEHLAPVDVTNMAGFDLHNITVVAVEGRPEKTAIIGVGIPGEGASRRDDQPMRLPGILKAGATTSFDVLLAYGGHRTDWGVLRFVVEDKDGDSWPIEVEVHFPAPPDEPFFAARWG
jgi:hypothetical protein